MLIYPVPWAVLLGWDVTEGTGGAGGEAGALINCFYNYSAGMVAIYERLVDVKDSGVARDLVRVLFVLLPLLLPSLVTLCCMVHQIWALKSTRWAYCSSAKLLSNI